MIGPSTLVRLARPSRDLAAAEQFYVAGLGLAVLLNAGVRFHKTCCGGPGYRPRTLSEVRERMAYARRAGEPFARAPVRSDVPEVQR